MFSGHVDTCIYLCVCACTHVLQTDLFAVHPITGKITVQGVVDLDQGSESVSFVITATDQAGLSGNVRL